MATTKLKFKAGTPLYYGKIDYGYFTLPFPSGKLETDFEAECPEYDVIQYGISAGMKTDISSSTEIRYKQSDQGYYFLLAGDAENWSLFDPKQKAEQTRSSNQLKKYFPAIAAAIVIIIAIILLIMRKRK